MYLVIKCGGSVFESLPDSFYQDIVHLAKNSEWKPIIVHGGGPLINSLLKKMNIETQFVNGLRVTTSEMLNIVEMVLSGSVNKEVVRKLITFGGDAFGVSGVDGKLFKAKLKDEKLGFVGEVTEVNHKIIENLCDQGFIPVVSPLGIDDAGQKYNINGDIAAAAMAKALGAKLCMVSDIPGIMVEENNQKVVLKEVTKVEVEKLIEIGTIYGGMIPKVQAAIDGLIHQVPQVVILNGLQEHSLIDFCEGKSIGTKLVLNREEELMYA